MESVLIAGYGSIGQRHARILSEMGHPVSVVSRREVAAIKSFPDIASALEASMPDYAVIADETSRHLTSLEELIREGFTGSVLVEKPLFGFPAPIPPNNFRFLAVGYNHRFFPVMQELRRAIAGSRLVSLSVYCGQYLPDWRPGTDYSKSSSASRETGGGVLRDLSHDIDAALWLSGKWKHATCLAGRFSDLDIETEDTAAIVMETERCPLVTVQLNYLDRAPRREVLVHTDSHTYRADLITGTFEENGKERNMPHNRDSSFIDEHRAVLAGDTSTLCSTVEALEIVRLIAALEESSVNRSWAERPSSEG